jgi:ankyrin repeat protein
VTPNGFAVPGKPAAAPGTYPLGNVDTLSDELLKAADEGNAEQVKRLISYGVDVNFRDYSGDWSDMDAVEIAAYRGHGAIVRDLLQAGARNRTFVEWAINQQRPDVVREWLALEDAQTLINMPVSDSEGSTLLTSAANGGLEIVKLLVEAGADVDGRRWGSDESALDVAVRGNKTDVINYLWPLCSQETRDRARLPTDPRLDG